MSNTINSLDEYDLFELFSVSNNSYYFIMVPTKY